MAEAPRRYWQDLTTEDFSALDLARSVALLPVGAIEQHGPHLPLSTDTTIVEGVVARALALLPDSAQVLVLPTQAVGLSPEHGDFSGTLSLTPETAIRAWSEIGAGLSRAGLRKLVILNSHGGQPQIVDLVAQRLRLDHGLLAVKLNTFRLGVPPGLFDEAELTHGIHGGALETAMMLHLRPDLVRRDKIADFRPLSRELEDGGARLSTRGPAAFAWAAQDLNPAGVCGDARKGDAEKGRAVIEHLAAALADILAEVARFPLARLKNRP